MGNRTSQRSDVDTSIDHHDVKAMFEHIEDDGLSTVELERCHAWIQSKFSRLTHEQQSKYVDYLIRAVRFELVDSELCHSFRAWLLSPAFTYQLDEKQICNYHVMVATQSRSNLTSWCRRLCF